MREHVFTQTAEWTQYSYTDDGRYLLSEEHSDGSSVYYTIDEATGLTTSVLSYNKADGYVRMNYEYNLDKSLKSVYYDSDDDSVLDYGERFISYTYDARGNLTSVNASGEVYNFAYNEWNQNTSVSTADRTLMSYAYPTLNGKAINATITGQSFGGNSANTQEFVYDALGNIVGRKSNGTLTQKYAYDNNGNLVSEIDSEDGTSTRYQYDAQSRLTQTNRNLLNGYTSVSSYLYNDNSNVTRARYRFNGGDVTYTILNHYTYDTDGKATLVDYGQIHGETTYDEDTGEVLSRSIINTGSNNATIASESYQYYDRTENGSIKGALKEISYGTNNNISYTYDAVGRIKTELKNGVLNREYVYDSMGQLTDEYLYDPAVVALYTTNTQVDRIRLYYVYNINGNIEETGICSEWVNEDGNTCVTDIDHNGYGYYSSGQDYWLSPLMWDGNEEIAYDSMGNPLNYFGKNFTWENGRELASITNRWTGAAIASYEYDASGLRISKTTTAGGNVYYVYDESSNLIFEKHSDYTLAFYYDGNGIRTHFTKKSDAGYETYYYRYNLQGDVIALLNDSGTVVAEYNYTAYGEHIGTITEIGNLNPFRYRGYYFDSETGYYYLQSRYYNPYTCRFINADAADFIGATGTPLSYNLFLYCENDPVNNTDPSGHIAHNVVGAAVGFFMSLGSYLITVLLGIETFSWWGLILNVVGGTASGAFGASVYKTGVQIIFNIIDSVAVNVVSCLRKPKVTLEQVISEVFIGVIVGLVSGLVGRDGNGKIFKKASNQLVRKFLTGNKNVIAKGIKYYIKSFSKLLKQKVVKPIFKAFVSGMITNIALRKKFERMMA